MANILVVAEHQNGNIKKSTYSSVTFARNLIDKVGGTFDILLVGSGVASMASKVAEFGARKILTADHAAFEPYTSQAWAQGIAEAAKATGATHVVCSASSVGKDCLPRVAVRLEAGMASDVIGFGKGSNYIRPMWAGNIMGEVEIATPIHVLTVRTTDFGAALPSGGSSPVEALGVTVSGVKMKVLERRSAASDKPDLTEARVVVAGGRGLKSKENFQLLEDLAKVLNAAIGASRAAVDAEFIDNDTQIGQTGKFVAPELYFAIGISGAIQHVAGMKNSKVIVAINKDEEAPIFQISDYGLVADLFKALPEITERLKATR